MMNKGLLYAIGASFCYSVMSFLAKLSTEASPITLIFFRSIISILILSFIFFRKGLSFKVVNKKMLFLRLFFGFLYLVGFYYAIKKMVFVVDAVTLSAFSNLSVPIIIFFWDGIKVPKIRFIAAFVGFVGVLLILKPSFNLFNIFGVVGLLSGISLGVTKVVLGKLAKTDSYQIVILYFFIGCLIISFFPTIYNFKGFENSVMWIYILFFGILTFLYQLFNTKAYFYGPPSKVSVVYFSAIMFSGLLEWVIYNKIPGMISIVGFLLIIFAGVLVYGKEEKKTSEVRVLQE